MLNPLLGGWGFDSRFCPRDGEFNITICQILCIPLPSRGWGMKLTSVLGVFVPSLVTWVRAYNLLQLLEEGRLMAV